MATAPYSVGVFHAPLVAGHLLRRLAFVPLERHSYEAAGIRVLAFVFSCERYTPYLPASTSRSSHPSPSPTLWLASDGFELVLPSITPTSCRLRIAFGVLSRLPTRLLSFLTSLGATRTRRRLWRSAHPHKVMHRLKEHSKHAARTTSPLSSIQSGDLIPSENAKSNIGKRVDDSMHAARPTVILDRYRFRNLVY